MERLTSKIEDAMIQCPLIKVLDDDNDYCQSQNCDCDNCKLGKQLVKLARYENEEEQGLLLRLPCKVGDAVYSCECGMIVRDFVHSFSTDANGLWAINMYGGIIGLFGLSVFITKEEADAALVKMKEGV